MKLIVTGYIIRHPLAGNLCAFFHYLLGFHRLGHEIVYVEEDRRRNPFKVYGRAALPCPRCRTQIKRIIQTQRSTFFCRCCQR